MAVDCVVSGGWLQKKKWKAKAEAMKPGRWNAHCPNELTVGAPVDQLLVAQLVRRRDVDRLNRFARRLRYRIDPGKTLEHQLPLEPAEPLLVDVEPDLERPGAQQETVVLDRRLVLRLQILGRYLSKGVGVGGKISDVQKRGAHTLCVCVFFGLMNQRKQREKLFFIELHRFRRMLLSHLFRYFEGRPGGCGAVLGTQSTPFPSLHRSLLDAKRVKQQINKSLLSCIILGAEFFFLI